MIQQSARLWNDVSAKGLLPSVTSIEDYEAKVVQGIRIATEWAKRNVTPSPTVEIIRTLHSVAFEEVHPWAGSLRKAGQLVMVAGSIGADGQRIGIELKMLEAQTTELLANTESPHEKMKALAFSHVRFERIHPFMDGNGRIGRILLDSQLNIIFGSKDRPILDRAQYMIFLARAQAGDLSTFTNLLLEREGMPEHQKAVISKPEFRIAPFYLSEGEPQRSLCEEIARSRMSGRSFQR